MWFFLFVLPKNSKFNDLQLLPYYNLITKFTKSINNYSHRDTAEEKPAWFCKETNTTATLNTNAIKIKIPIFSFKFLQNFFTIMKV